MQTNWRKIAIRNIIDAGKLKNIFAKIHLTVQLVLLMMNAPFAIPPKRIWNNDSEVDSLCARPDGWDTEISKIIRYHLICHLRSRTQNILAAKTIKREWENAPFDGKKEGIEDISIGGIFLEHMILIITAKSHEFGTLCWFTPSATVCHCDFCSSSVLIACKFVVSVYHEVGVRNAYWGVMSVRSMLYRLSASCILVNINRIFMK